MGSIKEEVVTSLRVLGVMFDSKLSWEKPNVHVSNIVKKRIYVFRRILPELSQSELIGTAHGSIYSIPYYTTGT